MVVEPGRVEAQLLSLLPYTGQFFVGVSSLPRLCSYTDPCHVGDKVKGKLEGSLALYMMAVKLDLEGRGIIERTLKSSPILHRIKK